MSGTDNRVSIAALFRTFFGLYLIYYCEHNKHINGLSVDLINSFLHVLQAILYGSVLEYLL